MKLINEIMLVSTSYFSGVIFTLLWLRLAGKYKQSKDIHLIICRRILNWINN